MVGDFDLLSLCTGGKNPTEPLSGRFKEVVKRQTRASVGLTMGEKQNLEKTTQC